jgi:hypothetical protein
MQKPSGASAANTKSSRPCPARLCFFGCNHMPLNKPKFIERHIEYLDIEYPAHGTRNNPFSIYFVYTAEGNLIIKGPADAVRKYVDANFPRSVFYITYWRNGECRGLWGSAKNFGVHWSQTPGGNRNLWTLGLETKDGYKDKVLQVRRVPRKWLKEYDAALVVDDFGRGLVVLPPQNVRVTDLENGLRRVLGYVWNRYNAGDPEAEKCYWDGVSVLEKDK